MTYADPNRLTDMERASEAFVSLRNDEIARHLSLHFHDQFSRPGGFPPTPHGKGPPRPAAGLGSICGGGGSIADRSREQTGPVIAASTHHNAPDVIPAGDPFAQYVNTPIAIYRDGHECERDAMQDGACR